MSFHFLFWISGWVTEADKSAVGTMNRPLRISRVVRECPLSCQGWYILLYLRREVSQHAPQASLSAPTHVYRSLANKSFIHPNTSSVLTMKMYWEKLC